MINIQPPKRIFAACMLKINAYSLISKRTNASHSVSIGEMHSFPIVSLQKSVVLRKFCVKRGQKSMLFQVTQSQTIGIHFRRFLFSGITLSKIIYAMC